MHPARWREASPGSCQGGPRPAAEERQGRDAGTPSGRRVRHLSAEREAPARPSCCSALGIHAHGASGQKACVCTKHLTTRTAAAAEPGGGARVALRPRAGSSEGGLPSRLHLPAHPSLDTGPGQPTGPGAGRQRLCRGFAVPSDGAGRPPACGVKGGGPGPAFSQGPAPVARSQAGGRSHLQKQLSKRAGGAGGSGPPSNRSSLVASGAFRRSLTFRPSCGSPAGMSVLVYLSEV